MSVISVASLLKAAATLVLASAMMMVRSDASTYGKWKLEVINLWLEIPKLLIISSRMWNIGYDLHFLWSTIYLTFGWTSTLVVSPFFREINFRSKCYPWVKHLGPGNWSSPHLIYFRNSSFFNVATKLSTMKFLCILNPNSALPINCMWRCALNVVYRAFYAISFYKSRKINMYALETTSLVFECLLAHRQLWQSCV